jgi:hypothetical protein
MSANFDALLKPPRARSYAVMVMMTVVFRGEVHSQENIQEPEIRVKGSDLALPLTFREIPRRNTLRETRVRPAVFRRRTFCFASQRSFRRVFMHSKVWTDMLVLAIPVAEKILRQSSFTFSW